VTGADFIKVCGGAAAGAVLGWAANALTLTGRVHALETGQSAIVLRLDALLQAKGVQLPSEARP